MDFEFKKISNIAFAMSNTGSIFRCLITRCGFESDVKRNFELHLRQHLNDGHIREDSSICITCSARINAENVIGEFTHMMGYHIENAEVTVKTEKVDPQNDISTDDDESVENVTHTSEQQLLPVNEIKVEKTADYDLSAMFSFNPVEASVESVPQTVSVDLQSDFTAEESESAKAVTKESRSSSNHRRSSSTRDKSGSRSNATSKDKSHSKSEPSSSKRSSSSKSSERKTCDKPRSEKDPKRSEKSEKPSSSSRSRKSSKSPTKSSSKHSTPSTRDKKKSSDASPRQKRSAHSSPARETASPDKKIRLDFANDVEKKTEFNPSTSASPEERIDESMQIDFEGDFIAAPQSDTLPASTVTNLSNESQLTEKPLELVSEFGTIPFKKIEGRIPKKISVVVTESSPMPLTAMMSHQSIETLPTPAPKIETGARVTASQLMPWIENLKRANFKFENHFKLMTTLRTICLLYKCMDADCSFSISNFQKYLAHLEKHKKESSETKFYQLCPYCKFKMDKPLALAKHIRDLHSFDRYQCSFCFFRSPEPGTVREHLLIHHNDSNAAVLECFGKRVRKPEEIAYRETKMFGNNSKKVQCKYCGWQTSLVELRLHFIQNHNIQSEAELPSHNPDILNCFYCSFDTLDMNEMSRHMVQHPTYARNCYFSVNQVSSQMPYIRKEINVHKTGTIKSLAWQEEKLEPFFY